MRQSNIRFPLILIAACALALCYLPALREIYFIWDGWSWRLCALKWAEDPSTLLTLDPSYSFRPLCRALYLGMFLVFGSWAKGYLAVTLVFHLAAALVAGGIVARLTKDRAAAWWTTILFAVASTQTEAIQWIASFPHVVLGLELFLILYCLAPESSAHKRIKAVFTVLLVLLAILTREPWIVLPPLAGVVLLWHGGWKGVFSPRGLFVLGGLALLVAAYLVVFRDIVSGGRVPGGETLMAVGWDAVPRLLRSLSQIFLSHIFYADLLRNVWGGIGILAVLMAFSYAGGNDSFRHAFFAMLFLLVALLPFAFYRSAFLSSRYFYLAGPFAVFLIYQAANGFFTLAGRWITVLKARQWPLHLSLALWALVSIAGVWWESHNTFKPAWKQSRSIESELTRIAAEDPPGTWHCVIDLPDPNRAIWECMAGAVFPGNKRAFLLAETPEDLAGEIRRHLGADQTAKLYRWVRKDEEGGRLMPLPETRTLTELLDDSTPRPEWGWPKDKARSVLGALIFRTRGH